APERGRCCGRAQASAALRSTGSRAGNDATDDAALASAHFRRVGVGVATFMDHQRAPAHVGKLQAGCRDRLIDGAVGGREAWQVTPVSVALRPLMVPGARRVEMTSGR